MVQSITEILQQRQEHRTQQVLLPALQQKSKELVSTYGNRESFLTTFNPDVQREICGNTDVCFFGGAPTLTLLNNAYGEKTAAMWLVPQLYNLSEYCGCRDKLSANQLKECASVIATEFAFLSVTELMLFFHRFKSGNYGQFYGAVDPLIITTSLREFLKERISVIEKREMERQAKQREQWEHQKVSYEEYCMMTYGTKEIPFSHTKENAYGSPLETPEKIYRTALSIESEKDREVKSSFRQAFAKKYRCSSQTYIANHEKD